MNKGCVSWVCRRPDGVVPVTMKGMPTEADTGQLLVLHGDALGIRPFVDLRAHAESGFGGRGSDEADDRGQTHQGLAAPVHGDMRKQAMLDLVPLGSSGWKVRDANDELRPVRELLKLGFPRARSARVAAAPVGRNEQFVYVRIGPATHPPPPLPYGLDRERGRVVVNADVDPSQVFADVVHAIGNRFAQISVQEIVNPNGRWLPLRLPFASTVLEITDKFLLFRVYGLHVG